MDHLVTPNHATRSSAACTNRSSPGDKVAKRVQGLGAATSRRDLPMKKWLAYTYILLGGLIAVLGAVFVLMYLWEAVVSRIGEPDQSLLFWYLPILFLGLITGTGGLFLFVRGINHIKTIRSDGL